jgi:hypothetical protein
VGGASVRGDGGELPEGLGVEPRLRPAAACHDSEGDAMNLLIPYVKLPDHRDPLLHEFTYGDVGRRGRKLKTLRPGDRIFFHTTIQGVKCVTACYTIARVMDTKDVVKDSDLRSKYRNPHIARWLEAKQNSERDDVMVFGDPITSRVLARPLPLDKKLAIRLSLNIPFPKRRAESMAIGSATRNWRQLTDKDVRILQAAMSLNEDRAEVDEMRDVVEELETSQAKGQGFQLDGKTRKAIEDYAMKAAATHFASLGYLVEDRHKDHPYDLLCLKKRRRLYVEVKGTVTSGNGIILTSGEVDFARSHKGEMGLFILHTIRASGRGQVRNGEKKVLLPWDVDEGMLKPRAFMYEVPRRDD